jgi:chaperonin GroES
MSKTIDKYQPVAGYVMIDPEEEEKMTSSGIVLPDTVSGDKPQEGKVIVVGPEGLHESGAKLSAPCKVGDHVVYKKWGGNEYKPKGSDVEYIFVKFDDIMAVIK